MILSLLIRGFGLHLMNDPLFKRTLISKWGNGSSYCRGTIGLLEQKKYGVEEELAHFLSSLLRRGCLL
jgi:hypothetical protein